MCSKMSSNTLKWVLQTGDMEEIRKQLLTADVNEKLEEANGRRPLHIAADYNHADVVSYLISLGADVNVVDDCGYTPLMTACYEGHVASVKVLLEKGADKNIKALNGQRALEAASEYEAIQALLK